MVLSLSSPAAARFLAAIREGHGLKGSARMAGIDKEVGYRFLRDRYLALRRDGMGTLEAVDMLGFRSNRVASWEAAVGRDGRHHLRVEAVREQSFWHAFDSRSDVAESARAAGVATSTVANGFSDLIAELWGEADAAPAQCRAKGRRR